MEATKLSRQNKISAEQVASVRVVFSGRGAHNVLELTRKPGLGTSQVDVTRKQGSYRRTTRRDLNRRLTKQLLDFVARVSETWPERIYSPLVDNNNLSWSLSLRGADGETLRNCEGWGRIGEPYTFLAFARGFDRVSHGFAADALPLARIEAALEWRNPLAYDEELDRVAGGAIACALGVDFFDEAMSSKSEGHRLDALREARLFFLDAAHLGSARASAYLARMALGLLGERDEYRARHSLERAVEGGSAEGCHLLGDLLLELDEENVERARELYEQACELSAHVPDVEGWAVAYERLAECLFDGVGGERDEKRALELAFDAELGLVQGCNSGKLWLKPELDRVMELSERMHASS